MFKKFKDILFHPFLLDWKACHTKSFSGSCFLCFVCSFFFFLVENVGYLAAGSGVSWLRDACSCTVVIQFIVLFSLAEDSIFLWTGAPPLAVLLTFIDPIVLFCIKRKRIASFYSLVDC